VVWLVVGVLGLVAIVFMLTKPRVPASPRLTAERLDRAASKTEVQLNRLAARLVAVRNTAPTGVDVNQATEADRLITEARTKLGQVRQAENLQQGEARLREVKQLLRRARRALELAAKGAAPRPPNM
jgi:hypothetical protein